MDRIPDVLPRTILVVEDDRDVREILHELLQEAGYVVLTAANGSEAVEIMCTGHPIHVVLMDLAMPVMDGFAAAAAMRDLPERSATPVVALTETNPHIPLPPPFARLLRKPFSLETLLGAVREVLDAAWPRDVPPD